ncbi:MAG: hypothetical protein PHH06_03545 [Candidatus Gracilibacteria bacterium]|nr:hypothetical protein [Candidatus Gracilibacteria bacterium]
MKKQKKAESLIAIIIAILILSFILIGVMSMLSFENTISLNFETEIKKYILELNSNSIIKKLDLSTIQENEEFYIYKNETTKTYEVLTGATNESYKYINYLGEKVDPEQNIGKTFTRSYTKKFDILRHKINPEEINNLVFRFDAQNPGSTLNDNNTVSIWYDQSGNSLNSYQSNLTEQPLYKENIINGHPGIIFDGSNDKLIINDTSLINTASFNKKSFAIVFKTGFDVNTTQVIYEQGDANNGYNIMISNSILYAGAYNNNWDSGHQNKFLPLGEIIPDSVYFVVFTQNSSNINDNENTLQIYLNGILVGTLDHVDAQSSHTTIGLGGINSNTRQAFPSYSTINTAYFDGAIGEIISWNNVLSPTEIKGIKEYFAEKWLGGSEDIEYNIVNTTIKKYNPN